MEILLGSWKVIFFIFYCLYILHYHWTVESNDAMQASWTSFMFVLRPKINLTSSNFFYRTNFVIGILMSRLIHPCFFTQRAPLCYILSTSLSYIHSYKPYGADSLPLKLCRFHIHKGRCIKFATGLNTKISIVQKV